MDSSCSTEKTDNVWFQVRNKIARRIYRIKRIFGFRDRIKREVVQQQRMEREWFDKKLQIIFLSVRLVSWYGDQQRPILKEKLEHWQRVFSKYYRPQ